MNPDCCVCVTLKIPSTLSGRLFGMWKALLREVNSKLSGVESYPKLASKCLK